MAEWVWVFCGGILLNSARNQFLGVLIFILLVAVSGCSSLSVNYDYDQDANWAKYRTYGWMETPERDTNPAAPLGDSGLLKQRIQNSINLVMADRRISTSNDPDLLVIYHLGSQEKIQVTDWGYRYSDYYWGYGGRQIDVYQFNEGSLVIDLIDAETQNLVWRGTGTKVIDQSQKSPEEMQDRANKIIRKIMESFPPK